MGHRADFRLGAVTFHPATDEISGPAGSVHLEPKVMDFAVHMAARADDVVGRDELIDEVWQGYPGASQSLSNAASKLRQALAEAGGDPELLKTVPKRGYSLAGPVESVDSRWRQRLAIPTAALALAVLGAILVANWAFESPGPVEQSVAVLPFENMSADPDQEYFAAGLAEELLNLLARVEGLKVAARTSSFLFDDANVAEIGRALNVANVVEGSVRKDGDRVRVTVQLIDADDGYHRWSETFERELADIFEIQDQIARAVVDALKTEVMDVPEQRPDSRITDSTEAYDLYLAGKQLLRPREHRHLINPRGHGDPEAYRRIIELFERAVAIDPGFAPAWAGIAGAYSRKPGWWLENYIDREAVGVRALEAARRAVELDPELAEAHASLGLALGKFADDPEQGRAHLQKAIELNPGYATAHRWLAHHYRNAGRLSDALPLMERAATLDPLNNTTVGWYARTLAAMGHYDEAAAELQRLHEDMPEAAIYQATPFTLAFESGRFVEAHYLRRSGSGRTASWESPGKDEKTGCCSDQDLFARIRVDVTLGRFDAARSWLAELREAAPESNLLRIAGQIWLLNGTAQYKRLQMYGKNLLDLDWPTSLRNRALNGHGRASLLAGDVDSAIRSLESAGNWTNWRARTTTLGLLAYAYLQAGRPEAAHDLANRALGLLEETESHGNRRPVIFFRQAVMLVLLERKDEAYKALEEAYEWGWRHYHQPDSFRPLLDQLIGHDPRYTAFIERVLADLEAMRTAVETERRMTHEF